MHVTNFVSKIDKKMYLEGSISSIKKTSNGYIAKLKPQGVSLQMTQTPGSDYAI